MKISVKINFRSTPVCDNISMIPLKNMEHRHKNNTYFILKYIIISLYTLYFIVGFYQNLFKYIKKI